MLVLLYKRVHADPQITSRSWKAAREHAMQQQQSQDITSIRRDEPHASDLKHPGVQGDAISGTLSAVSSSIHPPKSHQPTQACDNGVDGRPADGCHQVCIQVGCSTSFWTDPGKTY